MYQQSITALFTEALKNEQPVAIFAKKFPCTTPVLKHTRQGEVEKAEREHPIFITDIIQNSTRGLLRQDKVDSMIVSFNKEQVVKLKQAIKERLSTYLGINNAQELVERARNIQTVFKTDCTTFSKIRLMGLNCFSLNDSLFSCGYSVYYFGEIEIYPDAHTGSSTVFKFSFGIEDRESPFRAHVSFKLGAVGLASCIY